MILVVDANVVVHECLVAGDRGFGRFEQHELLAPELLVWEVASVLHECAWRLAAGHPTQGMGALTASDVGEAFGRLRRAPVRIVPATEELVVEAWSIATKCGFARLYDAAYVALAQVNGVPLVTLDARLRRSPASRLVEIIGPTEVRTA
ncbi:MAG: PIN domain-containing protein [Chloroflexota bacterium]|nr:MAG: PIN domain-containing protein [Chloroflexota bacterium]